MFAMSRREFLAATAATGLSLLDPGLRRRVDAAGVEKLRITGITWKQVLVPYQEFNRQALFRYHGVSLQLRTIFQVRTNSDLVGLGESWGASSFSDQEVAAYVGTSPFEWLGARKHLSLNMAMYDLMGKSLALPAWRLLGPRVRTRIPVAAWTVSRSPDAMAEEVRQAAGRGYRWLKYHIDEIHNVVDQTRAMQKVAPPGFRVHYDFNANGELETIAPILKEMARFPVVGRIEDPIQTSDRDGYRKLIAESDLEMLVHHGPVNYLIDRACDGYMAGHAPVGHAIVVAGVSEQSGLPFMLQQAGGQINQAFLAHEVAVFRGATIDHVNLAHLWVDDVTTTRAKVRNGTIPVPKGPGLGLVLDPGKLEKYARAPRPKYRPFLVRIRYRGGPTIIVRHDPHKPGKVDAMRFLDRMLKGQVPGDRIPGPTPGYNNAVQSDLLDRDNFGEFDRLWKATARGAVVTR
jgi:L-alanine-DL-glutamate epimerase-like enolase superfamily enzyme